MSFYEIEHTEELCGEIRVQGSKNEVLPVLVATLLAKDVSVIEGCPDISDVHNTIDILISLGCSVEVRKQISGLEITIDSSTVDGNSATEEQFEKMRASIIFLGALISINGFARIGYPGGCVIGKRPIDMHVDALREMGAEISEESTCLQGCADVLKGKEIWFPKRSVGATENILMAAALAEGTTIMHNCAREPEVVQLCKFLKLMGASVSGEGTDVITVRGVKNLHGCKFSVSGDRIVAATYMSAVCICGGSVYLKNVEMRYCRSTINLLSKAGMSVRRGDNGLIISMKKGTLKELDFFSTGPYPEIPTDIQPLVMAVMCFSKGITVIKENIFENRFMHCSELRKMGADIAVIEQKAAVINGRGMLIGSEVYGRDLRGSAALILAGLGAYGKTKVYGEEFVKRGYEDIVLDLQRIGGRIILKDEEEQNYNVDSTYSPDTCCGSIF